MRTVLAPAGAAGLFILCLLNSSYSRSAAGNPPRELITGITIYVDDDAANDPGPNDTTISDPSEDGSEGHPFDRVQEAIDIALEGDLVQVLPGSYLEDLVAHRENCAIRGAGRTETTLGPGTAGRFEFGGACPSLALHALTLEDVQVTLAPYYCVSLVLEQVDLVRSPLVVSAGEDNGDFQVRIRDVGMTDSSLLVDWVGGTAFAEIQGLRATGSRLGFDANNSTRLNLTLRDIQAPDLVLQTWESWFSGSGSSIKVNDSTIGGISTYLENGPPDMTLDVNNVRFTGRGIDRFASSEGETTVVRDSIFENGGIRIRNAGCRNDCQDATDDAVITGCLFQNAGIEYEAGRTYDAWIPAQDRFSLEVDGNRFRHGGIRALYNGRTLDTPLTGLLRITNNLFEVCGAALTISYELQDADPAVPPAAYRLEAINNTLVGCDHGFVVSTSGHAPGVDSITTHLTNNIVAGGTEGIRFDGTDDLQFQVATNDLVGQSGAAYAGDLPDQTGLNGNISAEPVFADPNTTDFRLSASSPCIDAGTTGPEVPALDYSGSSRPQDGNGDGIALPDIGAFEFINVDEDGDGFPAGVDCDDHDPSIHPGAPDLPGNSMDEDCDGTLACDPRDNWKTHGLFVQCVARVCGSLVKSRHVERAACNALIAQAAQPQGRKVIQEIEASR